jgi:hypothetical protein
MSVASATQMGNYEVEILPTDGTSLGLRSVGKSIEQLPVAWFIVSILEGFISGTIS